MVFYSVMKITIKERRDDSDPDCGRFEAYTIVNGKEIELAWCYLSLNESIQNEIVSRARKIFRHDIEIVWDC